MSLNLDLLVIHLFSVFLSRLVPTDIVSVTLISSVLVICD